MSNDSSPTPDLFEMVYDQLRQLAAHQLAQERVDHTLNPTALVHEVYLRLADKEKSPLGENRNHFLAIAAKAMQRILIDHARRKHSLKRGRKAIRQELDSLATANLLTTELLSLAESLERLASVDPRAMQLVQYRYFLGMTIPEAAELLGVSPRTAEGLWAFARAWLFRDLSRNESE